MYNYYNAKPQETEKCCALQLHPVLASFHLLEQSWNFLMLFDEMSYYYYYLYIHEYNALALAVARYI